MDSSTTQFIKDACNDGCRSTKQIHNYVKSKADFGLSFDDPSIKWLAGYLTALWDVDVLVRFAHVISESPMIFEYWYFIPGSPEHIAILKEIA
jgi:hypothetical protein